MIKVRFGVNSTICESLNVDCENLSFEIQCPISYRRYVNLDIGDCSQKSKHFQYKIAITHERKGPQTTFYAEFLQVNPFTSNGNFRKIFFFHK